MTRLRSNSLLLITLACFLCNVIAQETVTSETSGSIEDLLNLDESEEVLSLDVDYEEIPEATINATAEESIPKDKKIKVKSNLESLSDQELEALCKERGFDVGVEGGGVLSHEEYVEAAKRCLSLEDEMNAILAENPDLAAELETEIERMRLEKERLEQERDAMMAEKAALEEKLRLSGIDPSVIAEATALKTAPMHPQSFDEVLRESFVMLFDRVGQDMRFVGRVVRIALRPAAGGLRLVWRYTGPGIEGVIKQLITVVEGIMGAEQISVVRKQLKAASKLFRTHAAPVLGKARAIAMAKIQILNQQEAIRKVRLVVGAVLGPLRDSLLSGWRSVKPDLVNARTKTTAWIHRLKDEREPQDPAHQIKNEMRKSK
jgi:hypothetical protein